LSTRPTGINANRNISEFSVSWDDAHTSVYSFSLLRHACPCAECRGGHANMSSEPDPAVFDLPIEQTAATMIRKVELVGAYAMTVEWEDGHHYGIYNWHYLRALCPCDACRSGGPG